MAANKLQFVPILLPEMKPALESVVKDLQEKDTIEVELSLSEGETTFDCIYKVLTQCVEKHFVCCYGDIIGIVAYKIVQEQGYDFALLCILTTNKVKKHPKMYYKAAQQFIGALAPEYDGLVCEILEGYEPSLKMAAKLGFKHVATREVKGYNLLAHVLRIVRNK